MNKLHLPDDKEIRSLIMTVGVYGMIVMIKLVAYFYTHVMALLAESFHNPLYDRSGSFPASLQSSK